MNVLSSTGSTVSDANDDVNIVSAVRNPIYLSVVKFERQSTRNPAATALALNNIPRPVEVSDFSVTISSLLSLFLSFF